VKYLFPLLASLALCAHPASAGSVPDGLVGLWGAEAILGPQVRGDITIRRAGGRWDIRAGGFEVSVPASGKELRADLPGGQGELRARLEPDGRTLHGMWIQPAGDGAAYASPVPFTREADGAWRGKIAPLSERWSLYLRIERSTDGALTGSFRNPERRWTGGSAVFRVTSGEGHVRLADPASGQERFVQPYDPKERRILMEFGSPIALTPRTPDQAVGYFPRSPSAPPYEYRAPVPEDDGWPTARAATVGLDEARLRDLVRWIAAVDPAEKYPPLIHSVLVERHGKLVLEEYFYGYAADRLHDLRSASKSFTSLMAGIAMDRGAGFSMATPVEKIFPPADPSAPQDPRRAKITVGELFTHSSGLACDDNDDASPGNEDTMQSQDKQRDWYRYVLDLPMEHDPGTTYAYCSGGINLAGGVVARTTGAWLPEFFDRYVARPLGIRRYAMNLMPDGQGYSAGGVHMRPRDLLKFGQLYLRGGVWRGRRVVSERWVRESTARQMDSPSGSDGYGWHRNTLHADGRDYAEFEANGNGGQFLIVVPEADLAVVFTAGNYGQYGVWRKFRDELVPKYVLAGLESKP
jgi:CubicO group peptidase (beta-lactamase class C family)